MRRVLLIFVLPLLIIVAVVFTVFGVVQVRIQEKKQMDELQRKAKSVAESIEISARYVLVNHDLATATRMVELFQKRDRLQGCAIYDANANIVAITERFAEWKRSDVNDIVAKNIPASSFQAFEPYYVYSYVLPIAGDANSVLGAVEVIYDTSYMFSDLLAFWKRIGVSLAVLVLLIFSTVLLIQWQLFILPVNRLTEWFHRFQKGETDAAHPIAEAGELGKLASEVEQVALSLRIARKVASEEASERIQKEDIWTEAKLRDLIKAKLGDGAFFVVSNREPYMHMLDKDTGKAQCIRPAGGVVTAIDPILRASGGTWIAHGSGNADRKFVNSKDRLGVPPEDNRYILKRVWLSKEEEQGYYYGFSNEGLWPLCHITYVRPIFRETDWQMYKAVNQKFADVIVEELPAKNPFVFIQDYHFTLLGKMIKEKRPDATSLYSGISRGRTLKCLRYARIIRRFWTVCLAATCSASMCNITATISLIRPTGFLNPVSTPKNSVWCVLARKRLCVPFPISVNGYIDKQLSTTDKERMEQIREELGLADKIIGVGVERIDYTKGIKERILAIDRFLEKYPQYKNKFVFIQLAAPSRTHIKSYHDLMAEIDELVEKKNWKHSEGDWKPIIYLCRHFSPEEIRPYYALADICIVSSLA